MPGSADELISQMNRLCIEMTHTRRKSDGKEMRKKVLRRMKQLLKRIGGHARRHRDKLASNHAQTKWSPKQSGNIIDRIDDKLALLPEVIRQAHERIIGGRKLKSKDKILSAHEREIDVIVRGKAGKELEFGNVLFISESIAQVPPQMTIAATSFRYMFGTIAISHIKTGLASASRCSSSSRPLYAPLRCRFLSSQAASFRLARFFPTSIHEASF